MPVGRPFRDELVAAISDRLRLLALPLRIRIIDHLDNYGEASVQDIADRLDVSQQNASRHLRLLADAGCLDRREEGRFVWYRLREPGAFRIIESISEQVLAGAGPSEC